MLCAKVKVSFYFRFTFEAICTLYNRKMMSTEVTICSLEYDGDCIFDCYLDGCFSFV